MRVISGKLRGKKLICPKDNRIRPTSDKVKGAIFNILQAQINGTKCLDLFAGTGNLGIEAISRGANHCTFIENNAESLKILSKNIQLCGILSCSRTIKQDVLNGLQKLHTENNSYDIIFADPPYDYQETQILVAKIIGAQLLKPEGIIIIEHDKRVSLDNSQTLSIYIRDHRFFGKTAITMLAYKQDNN